MSNKADIASSDAIIYDTKIYCRSVHPKLILFWALSISVLYYYCKEEGAMMLR